jgi:hypothetical protein
MKIQVEQQPHSVRRNPSLVYFDNGAAAKLDV